MIRVLERDGYLFAYSPQCGKIVKRDLLRSFCGEILRTLRARNMFVFDLGLLKSVLAGIRWTDPVCPALRLRHFYHRAPHLGGIWRGTRLASKDENGRCPMHDPLDPLDVESKNGDVWRVGVRAISPRH
jgi:hypothetical protein